MKIFILLHQEIGYVRIDGCYQNRIDAEKHLENHNLLHHMGCSVSIKSSELKDYYRGKKSCNCVEGCVCYRHTTYHIYPDLLCGDCYGKHHPLDDDAYNELTFAYLEGTEWKILQQ